MENEPITNKKQNLWKIQLRELICFQYSDAITRNYYSL